MKIKYLIIQFLLLPFLFIGCKAYETEICKINVVEESHCTYSLAETSVPKYSFAKIQIIPDKEYTFSKLEEDFYYDPLTYYKSPDEENTYYFLVEEEELFVKIKLEKKPYYSISTQIKNGTITPSKTETFAGDTVTFQVNCTNEYFYYDPSSIKINGGSSYSDSAIFTEYSQSKNNPNEFSFIMPNKNVNIYVPVKYGFTSIKNQKAIYEVGEKIIFDIENHTPDAKFDVYLVENYKFEKSIVFGTKILSNVKLTEKFELPEPKILDNKFTIIVYPYNSYYPNNAYEEVKSPTVTLNRTSGVLR